MTAKNSSHEVIYAVFYFNLTIPGSNIRDLNTVIIIMMLAMKFYCSDGNMIEDKLLIIACASGVGQGLRSSGKEEVKRNLQFYADIKDSME